MASEEAHDFIRAQLVAMWNPAGDPANYAIIRNTVDRALKWMDGPQVVQYLGIGGDFVDAATAIDEKVAGYERQAAATTESTKTAARIQSATAKRESRLTAGGVETGFITPPPASTTTAPTSGAGIPAPAEGSRLTTSDATVAAWMMRKYGMSPEEAADALLDPEVGHIWKAEFIQDGRTKDAGAGRAPLGKQTIERGGKLLVFDPNNGSFSDSGIAADPSFDLQTDAAGDLYAFDKTNRLPPKLVRKGFDVPKSDPNFETVIDKRSGVAYQVNKKTGERVPLGQYDFAGIDPEREQARLDLGTRQAGQRLALDTETQRRTRSLAEADFVRQSLAGPPDFLFRAALTRGQTSGVPRLTQADIINQFNSDIAATQAPQPRLAAPAPAASPPPASAPPAAPVAQNAPFVFDPMANSGQGGWSQGGKAVSDVFSAATPARLSPQAAADAAAWANTPPPENLPADAYTNPAYFNGLAPYTTVDPRLQPRGSQPSTPAKMWTQEEIANLSRQTAPPAVRSIIEGRDPGFVQLPFAAPTRQSLLNLTDSEGQALNTALGAEYGIGAEEVVKATEQRFDKPRQRRSARLLV